MEQKQISQNELYNFTRISIIKHFTIPSVHYLAFKVTAQKIRKSLDSRDYEQNKFTGLKCPSLKYY